MIKDKITPENYEGYCELFKSRVMTTEQIDKYRLKMFMAGIIPGILFVIAFFSQVSDILIFLAMINFFITPVAIMAKAVVGDRKKSKTKLSSKYPNINVNIATYELENMLLEAKILEIKSIDGKICKKLDIEGYENYIKCEKIRQETMEDYKDVSFEINHFVSVDNLEKQKVKVKTMNKTGM